jgi:hypothetical protein
VVTADKGAIVRLDRTIARATGQQSPENVFEHPSVISYLKTRRWRFGHPLQVLAKADGRCFL